MTPDTSGNPFDRLNTQKRLRVRKAAFHATHLYPGPVGEALSRELWDWEKWGWRFGGDGLIARLVEHILEKVEDAA